jgi:hypothetical protein
MLALHPPSNIQEHGMLVEPPQKEKEPQPKLQLVVSGLSSESASEKFEFRLLMPYVPKRGCKDKQFRMCLPQTHRQSR